MEKCGTAALLSVSMSVRKSKVPSVQGVEIQLHSFLISAPDSVGRLYLRLGRFPPGEIAPGTHSVGSWVGPSVRLNV